MSQNALVFKWILCLLFSANLNSQTLYLKVESHIANETKLIDSLNYKKEFQDYSSLNNEVIDLKTRIEKIGYLESEMHAIKKINDSTFLAKFQLHSKYKFIRIYDNDIVDRKLLNFISDKITDTYFEIRFETLEETMHFLNSKFIEKGNPFSELQIKNIIKLPDLTLTGDLTISNQKARTIDAIIVKGYEKFPKSFIRHYLKLKPQQLLSLKTISAKTEELENLSFSNQIKEPELLFTKDSTSLYIYVEKTKSNSFDGYLGFGTNDQTNKVEFNGYLNLNLTNTLNYGESFKLFYRSDESKQRTFEIKTNLPYLFSTPLGAELSLQIFKKDTSFVTTRQSAKLIYQFNSRNSVAAGVFSETSNKLLKNTSTLIDDYKANFFIVNYTHIKQQKYNLLFPVNFFFDVTLGKGQRSIENLKEQQASLNLDTYKIFNLNDRNSIYTRFNSASLFSDTYTDNELLRFGGINSIRGFEENSLLSNVFMVLNTEYRYQLSNTIYLHSILDVAYFENDNLLIKQKLFGYGFGFGLLTNAGLFKLNYSSGKVENQKFRISDSKIQISLTASF
jgi:outer membrane protein assembly factor BamA